MVEIIFKGCILQKGDRVKIPKPIIDTLNFKAGEKILIKFDAQKKLIVIEKEKKEK